MRKTIGIIIIILCVNKWIIVKGRIEVEGGEKY